MSIFNQHSEKTHLVSADELIWEGQARHEPPLLQPENGSKGPREEDPLNSRKCNHTLTWNTSNTITNWLTTTILCRFLRNVPTKSSIFVTDPVQGPISLPLHTGESFNGIEEVVPVWQRKVLDNIVTKSWQLHYKMRRLKKVQCVEITAIFWLIRTLSSNFSLCDKTCKV